MTGQDTAARSRPRRPTTSRWSFPVAALAFTVAMMDGLQPPRPGWGAARAATVCADGVPVPGRPSADGTDEVRARTATLMPEDRSGAKATWNRRVEEDTR